ncbi:hypothetical protein HYT84_00945, partial [Candidatus Micrarchaeota archaeon]|nr:hypothetical protein [Candidatus Micrarchaeota archaeon]
MFYPVKMQKVRIIVIKSLIDEIVKKLHELGLVEINVFENEQVEKGIPLERHNEISQYLIKIRGIKNSLEKYTDQKPNFAAILNPLQEAKNITIDEQLKGLEIEKDQIHNDLSRIKSELYTTEFFLGFKGIDFSRLTTKLTNSFVGEINRENLNP